MTVRAQMSENEKHQADHTPLMSSALEGNTGRVKTELESGADINAKDDEGRTALMFAVINMHYETVKALLDHGADVNARARDGGTGLILAASSGDAEIVRELLNQGADISGRYSSTSKTAETLAAEKGYTGIVELIKSASGTGIQPANHPAMGRDDRLSSNHEK